MEETDLNFPSPASDDHCDLRGQLVCKAGTGVRERGVIIQLERKHPADQQEEKSLREQQRNIFSRLHSAQLLQRK